VDELSLFAAAVEDTGLSLAMFCATPARKTAEQATAANSTTAIIHIKPRIDFAFICMKEKLSGRATKKSISLIFSSFDCLEYSLYRQSFL
jgi:hypothetical protein